MKPTLRIYHQLPTPARSVAASLRGMYLRSWRYGPETDDLASEALEREHWSQERWQAWQQERLSFVLHRAATAVPYYRDQWAERRRKGDRRSWDQIENWPVLEKEPLRVNPEAFVADDCDRRRMFQERTTGTSGKHLDLWWTQKTVRLWYAIFEARCRQWYGVSRRDRWAMIGGQLVVPTKERKPPFWVKNVALRQLYMSVYHLAPDLLPHYVRALDAFQPRFLHGYSSALYELAQGVLEHGRPPALNLAVVTSNAEPLFPHQREAIGRAFECPVRETYGMAEAVAAGTECHAGRLHLWPEIGWLEIMDEGQPVPDGVPGELVSTGLLNADMPLIRYRVGDRVVRSAGQGECECGRALPSLSSIEGRCDDVLYMRNGSRVGRLDGVFKARLPIVEAQIIQESLDRVRIRYVPTEGFTAATGRHLINELRIRVGDVDVVLDPVTEIPRTAGGKFRAVICNVPPSARNAQTDIRIGA